MQRVFLFEKVPFNTDACEEFGVKTTLFDKGGDRKSLFDPLLIDDILSRLQKYEFDPLKDSIALTGRLNQVVLLVCALAENYENINLLMFDARTEKYVPFILHPPLERENDNNNECRNKANIQRNGKRTY